MTARRAHAGIAIAIAAAVYALRLDDVSGLVVDDAFYIVLGKAIAAGEGFRLISSAVTPIMPAGVPPGFPAILSTVFFGSTYPANVLLLKLISVAAMAAVGYLCWFDLTRHRNVGAGDAIWISAAVVLTPALVFLATSTVMAECVFTLAQLAAVVAVERIERSPRPAPAAAVAGVVAAGAMFVRSAGAAVVIAAAVYLASRRQWRPLTAFAATVLVLVLPWQLYARAHVAPFAERYAHGGTIAYSYSELLAMTQPGAVGSDTGLAELAARAWRNVGGVITRDVGAVVAPELYRGPSESGEEVVSIGEPGRGSMGGAAGTRLVSTLLVVVLIAGVLRTRAWLTLPALVIAASIAMIAAVPADTFRYVVPLAPFMALFLWRALPQEKVAHVALLSVLGLHLLDHGLYLRERAAGRSTWIAEAREIDQVVDWLNSPAALAGPVAATNPGLIYLRTGRQGVASAFLPQQWETWKAAGLRYVIATHRMEVPRQGTVRLKTAKGLWIVEM